MQAGISIGRIARWIEAARDGEQMTYWKGHFAEDIAKSDLSGRLKELRNLLLFAQSRKLIILTQKRSKDGDFEYNVKRTKNLPGFSSKSIVDMAAAKDMLKENP